MRAGLVSAGAGNPPRTRPATSVFPSLVPEDIVLDAPIGSAQFLLAFAAGRMAARHALDPAAVTRALERREQACSTGLGRGVAIPHARVDGLIAPATQFLRVHPAVHFGAPDGLPVTLFLVLLVPTDGDPEEHLVLLATAAQLFCESTFRTELAAVRTPGSARDLFAHWVARPPSTAWRSMGAMRWWVSSPARKSRSISRASSSSAQSCWASAASAARSLPMS